MFEIQHSVLKSKVKSKDYSSSFPDVRVDCCSVWHI